MLHRDAAETDLSLLSFLRFTFDQMTEKMLGELMKPDSASPRPDSNHRSTLERGVSCKIII